MQSDWRNVSDMYLDYLKSDDDRLRRELLDPIMVGEIAPPGKTILDLGCGEGYFSQAMRSIGAKQVVGVDIAPALIESARRRDPAGSYEVYDIVPEPVHWPATFDAVVAHMVMMDISDIDTAYAKISNSLLPLGRLVLSIVNPYYAYPVGSWRSAAPGGRSWRRLGKRAPSKSKYDTELTVTDYFGARLVSKRLGGMAEPVPHYHRQVADYINLATKHGLTLKSYLEPSLTAELAARYRGLYLAKSLTQVPLFLILTFEKQG